MNSLLKQNLKNLKINFDEKKSIIKYEEYNINPIIDIEYSNILNQNDISLLISWLPNKPSNIKLNVMVNRRH